jgi:uncharacterized membrane protein YuzA (DUF378 family)
MMFINQQMFSLLVQILLIAGALNWGSVAANKFDFVDNLVGATNGGYVKMTVGIAGIYALYLIVAPYFAPYFASAPAPAPAPAPVPEQPQQ